VAQPGAVADAEWSSLVVTPSGSVLNVAVVANATGEHDRLLSIDRRKGEATLQLLDGWQGGDRRYYHFVTDSSDPAAAAIEAGVYAPRLGNLPEPVESNVFDRSARLGFSPTMNGETGLDNPERQGLNSTIVDGGATRSTCSRWTPTTTSATSTTTARCGTPTSRSGPRRRSPRASGAPSRASAT
jgi:hypothetical protein